jgi:organic hydroperoxide reductase OsmC/OhrA
VGCKRDVVLHLGIRRELPEAAFARPVFGGHHQRAADAAATRRRFDIPALDMRDRARLAAIGKRANRKLEKPHRGVALFFSRHERRGDRRHLGALEKGSRLRGKLLQVSIRPELGAQARPLAGLGCSNRTDDHFLRAMMWAHEKQVALKTHAYPVTVRWTATNGEGTKSYRSYSRAHSIGGDGKPEILASSDPAFRGDASRYNPEELLVASLSSCHMLWYLHLCSVNTITVVEYRDDASGTMEETEDGSARFTRVTLRPAVTITSGDPAQALELHHEAHRLCFIARSINFPVEVAPEIAFA